MIGRWFRKSKPGAPITEQSRLEEVAALHPHLYEFLKARFGLEVADGEKSLTLRELVDRHGLPPSQIVFMEVQLAGRHRRVNTVAPREAQRRLTADSRVRVLDVRETWEWKLPGLPGARPLDGEAWDAIVREWDKDTPILLYCHFGIRSLDAANQLLEEGFTDVHVLEGGIQAWSVEVDPSIPQYEGSWC